MRKYNTKTKTRIASDESVVLGDNPASRDNNQAKFSSGETCEQYWQKHGLVKSKVLSKHNSEQIVKPKLVGCTCCHRKVNGMQIHWNVAKANSRYGVEDVPIWTACEKCGKYLSHLEENNSNKYLGMCIECWTQSGSMVK